MACMCILPVKDNWTAKLYYHVRVEVIQRFKWMSSSAHPASKCNQKTVYVESYGCTANKFDLEVMLAHLTNAGYKIVGDPERGDVLVINTCGVKTQTESRMLARLQVLSGFGKPVIVAGCLPKINMQAIKRVAPSFAAALDPYSVDRITIAVERALAGERNILFLSDRPIVKITQPKIRLNRAVEIVQIAEGCTGACTFCCVRFARGRLFSYPKELILERVKKAVSEGVKEIWITSQDNGAYGLDIKTNLAELLEEICRVNGDFMVRVGMMNPNHAMRILEPLVEAYRDRKVFKFLHLPLQSGDDDVLKRMNRYYTVKDFMEVVNFFREAIPRITLATDIICGFPGESEEAFERTMRVIEDVKPDIVNISKFLPRPRTPAASMRQLPTKTLKERSRRLSALASRISLERNSSWIGWEGRIIVDEKGRGNSWIGRNFAYKPVVIRSLDGVDDPLGKYVWVRITEAYTNYLEGEVINLKS